MHVFWRFVKIFALHKKKRKNQNEEVGDAFFLRAEFCTFYVHELKNRSQVIRYMLKKRNFEENWGSRFLSIFSYIFWKIRQLVLCQKNCPQFVEILVRKIGCFSYIVWITKLREKSHFLEKIEEEVTQVLLF